MPGRMNAYDHAMFKIKVQLLDAQGIDRTTSALVVRFVSAGLITLAELAVDQTDRISSYLVGLGNSRLPDDLMQRTIKILYTANDLEHILGPFRFDRIPVADRRAFGEHRPRCIGDRLT